nr:RAMP superfamily CRISPR-associated protein [Candidatus Sigynarchaeota archaeon]
MADLLSKITKRTVVNVCITTEEPVHVGSGKDAGVSSVDLPIVRDAAGKPVIPGSSIKGMFRAHFSRIVGSLDDASMNALNIRRTAGNLKDIEKEFLKGSRENREEIIEKSLGTIDKLFGISGLAAAIVFTDATVESKTVITRKHVRIDPNTDRAMKGALFDLEAVPDMAKFKFTIVFDTITDEEHYGDVNKFVEDVRKYVDSKAVSTPRTSDYNKKEYLQHDGSGGMSRFSSDLNVSGDVTIEDGFTLYAYDSTNARYGKLVHDSYNVHLDSRYGSIIFKLPDAIKGTKMKMIVEDSTGTDMAYIDSDGIASFAGISSDSVISGTFTFSKDIYIEDGVTNSPKLRFATGSDSDAYIYLNDDANLENR